MALTNHRHLLLPTTPQECSLTHTYTPSNLSCSSSSTLSFAAATSATSTLCDIKKPRESNSNNNGVHRRSSRKGSSWVRQISRYCIRSNRISSTTSGLFAHHQQGSKINSSDNSSRSVKNNTANIIADTDSIINTTSSNFVSKMLKLARNHSMTLSEKSITDTISPGSHRQNSNDSNAESESVSPSSWTTLAGPSALHAVLISHILRGEFLQISEVGLDALIRDMTGKDSKALELIKITGAVISGTDAKLLAKLIRSSEAVNIKVLRLDRNAISQDAFRFIFDAWKMNRTITTLSMSRAGVNDKSIKYIAKALAKNTSIKELDLSSNRITSSGIEVLCNALIFNRTLTRLCLQSNNIKKAGAPFLATLLAKNRVIRHINIGSNGLGNEGCVLIAEAVRFNRALSSLSLDMNEMGHVGATAMAAALQSNRHLMYLYISHNNIGDQGLADMCESLKRNNTIIGLDLEMNQICNGQSLVGIQALADVLKVNTCLRELNLSYNIFTGEAIQSLMEGVDLNSTLESIMLTNCCVATEGALAIAEILPSAKGLQNLGLTANPDIAVEGYWALATGISKNRSMKGIQLDYNSDDRHDLYDSIQQSLTTNFIWQQAIYKASCRILVLARIVLLGRPVQQRMLQSQQLLQQQQQQHSGGGAWKLLRKVGIGRTSSSNSLTSLLSLSKIKSSDSVGGSSSNGADGSEGTTTDSTRNTSQSASLPPSTPESSSMMREIRPTPTRQQHLGNQLLLSHRQLQLMDQGLLLGQPHLQPHFQDQSCYLNSPPASRSHSPSISQPEQQQQEYNAHKVMAHLGNMPYEILENICSFLDPGRNMTIAQIRATIEVAGTRSTLTPYYTKAKMLERIFCSRYIPSVGLRYSIRNGEERP
ncbi:hypothetical protein BGZ98_001671 [Dissophora globulifera]|nr:hypothetical protein BGZ98_001671 [Dissophora globulifera]